MDYSKQIQSSIDEGVKNSSKQELNKVAVLDDGDCESGACSI